MGNTKKDEMESIQEIPLIDILYKDSYRIDSYIAQLLNGTLRSVKRQKNTSQGSSSTGELSIKLLKGQHNSSELISKLQEQNIDPHDHNVIDLLNILDLPLLDSLPVSTFGQLVHLQGNISIRDFKTISELIPAVSKTPQLFHIDKKEASSIHKIFSALSKILPLNIELELTLSSGELIRGILKDNYLLDSYADIVSMYGTTLPGLWHIIGIFNTNDYISASSSPSNQLRNGLDAVQQAARTLYDSGENNGNIIPILIFTELDK